MMSITQEAGKVATSVVDVMKGAPLILALLLVNVGFIAIIVYTLSAIAARGEQGDKQHYELVGSLLKDLRACYTGSSPQKSMLFRDIQGKR